LRGVILSNSWVKVITITGSVGVFAFLFSLFMGHVFSENITKLLGSEKIFYIIVGLLIIFSMGILIALLKPQPKKDTSTNNEPQQSTSSEKSGEKDISVTYSGSSTHNGDNRF
jgi:hypothetical protein